MNKKSADWERRMKNPHGWWRGRKKNGEGWILEVEEVEEGGLAYGLACATRCGQKGAAHMD